MNEGPDRILSRPPLAGDRYPMVFEPSRASRMMSA